LGVSLGSCTGGLDLGSKMGSKMGCQFEGSKISSFWGSKNSSKTAQFVVFRMLLHMYNMYLYASIHIRTCIICDNMLNTAEYVLWGVPHGVVGGGDGQLMTVDGMIYTA
jgi:xylose isomerase